jgi:tetratricopeptide (TPR) repeat protein
MTARLTRWVVLVVTCASLAALGDAWAQKRDPEKEKEAREHYATGMRHYDLNEIDDAIDEFRKAYSISGAPGLLFNIAQAYRLKKDYEHALQFYRNYLRVQTRAPNRKDVEARVVEMEQLIKEAQQVSSERPHGVIPPTQGDAEEPASEPTPPTDLPPAATAAQPQVAASRDFIHSKQALAGLAVGAVGVAALITAAGLGGAALSAKNDYNSGCDAGLCDQSRWDAAHGMALGTDVLIGVGAAAVVTGVILILTRPKAPKTAMRASLQGGR